MKKKIAAECKDSKCPFHGSLKTRGRSFVGTVVSTKMQKSATVEWERRFYIRKYERFERRRSKIKAHVPDCIRLSDGDIARIIECRPLSKTINFVVIENLGKEKGYAEKMQARQEAKAEVKRKEEKPAEEDKKDEADKSQDN